MDDDEDDVPTCPLCLEELDATDRAVKACQCGYQVCLWCLHTIRERLNRRCPACRTPYDEHNFKFDDFNPEQAAKEAKERKTAKKERERREKLKEIERERERALVLSKQKAKSNLKHVRILQRNLVFVNGLSLTLAREEVIRRPDMFGRYGRIIRALVNRSHPFNVDAPGGPSISAYVQYARDADAMSAVRGMGNTVYDGREIRCAIATTKYCDALLRNAQVSDPAATYHCGNPQCMYYHSTSHTDSVLTKEEALARQYGPPPPAHLFVTVPSRRSNFSSQNYHRSSNANAQATTQSNSRSTNRSTTINSTFQPLASSPSNQNSFTANQAVALGSPTTSSMPSNPTGVTSISSSPKTRPPSSPTAPVPVQNLTVSSSPRHSPPSSPPSDLRIGHRRHRSPSPADLPLAQSPPISSPKTSVPLPSSATWASVQHNDNAARSPVRRTRPSPTESVARSRPVTVPVRRKTEAPPGFEDSSLTRSPTAPSRPPGFDSSPPTHTGATESATAASPDDGAAKHVLSATESVAHKSNLASSPPLIARPPGFGHSPPPRPSAIDSGHGEVTEAWLKEASKDTVYASSPEHRTNRSGAIGGEVGSRPSMSNVRDGMNPRGGLEQVLRSIGGTLGVSSEIQHMQPPVSMQFESNGAIPHKIHPPGPDAREQALPSFHVFNSRPDASFDNEPRDASVAYTKGRVDSYPADLNRVVQTGDVSTGALPSHTSVPANLSSLGPVNVNINIVRTAIALREMRRQSRFLFARDNSLQVANGDTQAPSSTGTGYEASTRQHVGAIDVSAHHQVRPEGLMGGDYVDSMGSKKASSSARQLRSRFDFVDQGSSPTSNIGAVISGVGADGVMYNSMGHIVAPPTSSMGVSLNQAAMMQGGKVNVTGFSELVATNGQGSDGYVEASYHQHGTGKDKVGSAFSSATKWTPEAVNHNQAPKFEPQIEEMMQHGAHSTAIAGTNVNLVEGLVPTAGGAGTGVSGLAVLGGLTGVQAPNNVPNSVQRNATNIGGIMNEGGVEAMGASIGLPPPGFRQATSGISPDTTAGDQTSANSGVAANVVPGGTRSEVKVDVGNSNDYENEEKSRPKESKNAAVEAVDDTRSESRSSGASSKATVFEATTASGDNEDGRKRSHAQRKRDRKARQARETVGRERKIAKDSYGSNTGGRVESSCSSSTCSSSTSTGTGTTGTSSGNKDAKKSNVKVLVKAVKKEEKPKKEAAVSKGEDGSKRRSVSDLEREVEEARAIEAQLLDELTKINQRLELWKR